MLPIFLPQKVVINLARKTSKTTKEARANNTPILEIKAAPLEIKVIISILIVLETQIWARILL